MFIARGGLPLSCFTHIETIRKKWFEDYFETLLSRDVALVDSSLAGITIRQGLQMLQYLAIHQGTELSLTDLSDAGSTRLVLVKRFIQALDTLCLIEPVYPLKKSASTTSKPKYEWKDIGLWNHLLLGSFANLESDQTLRLLLTQEFRSQLAFESKMVSRNFYKTHNASHIPWIFKRGHETACITTSHSELPKPYEYRALKQFVQKEKNAVGIIIGPAKSNVTELSPRVWLMPYSVVF
jgi:predicted AAA+ superfamily ATPase